MRSSTPFDPHTPQAVNETCVLFLRNIINSCQSVIDSIESGDVNNAVKQWQHSRVDKQARTVHNTLRTARYYDNQQGRSESQSSSTSHQRSQNLRNFDVNSLTDPQDITRLVSQLTRRLESVSSRSASAS